MRFRSILHKLHSALQQRLALPASLHLQVLSPLLARLSPREQRFVIVATLIALGAFLHLLIIDPLWQMQIDRRARVVAKERELQEIIALRREYLAAKAKAEHTQAVEGANLSPIGFLETLARNVVGQEKVIGITPTSQENRAGASFDTIELKLSDVSLHELVEILYKIETAGSRLHPQRLSIKKRYKDPYTFDVLLTTVAISAR